MFIEIIEIKYPKQAILIALVLISHRLSDITDKFLTRNQKNLAESSRPAITYGAYLNVN